MCDCSDHNEHLLQSLLAGFEQVQGVMISLQQAGGKVMENRLTVLYEEFINDLDELRAILAGSAAFSQQDKKSSEMLENEIKQLKADLIHQANLGESWMNRYNSLRKDVTEGAKVLLDRRDGADR